MECIVLAGGLGTRLRNVIDDLPKCMAPVGNQPFLYYTLKYLERQNVSHIILSLGYKYDFILNWIDKSVWPFKISYSIEESPAGTGGAIKLSMTKSIEDCFLVINGDTYFDVSINNLFNKHLEYKADITIALKPMKNFSRYGNVIIDGNQRIVMFQEKQNCINGLVNGGVYLINKNSGLFENQNHNFSFETDILQKYYSNKNFYASINDGYFIDIGIPKYIIVKNKSK